MRACEQDSIPGGKKSNPTSKTWGIFPISPVSGSLVKGVWEMTGYKEAGYHLYRLLNREHRESSERDDGVWVDGKNSILPVSEETFSETESLFHGLQWKPLPRGYL